MVTICDRQVYGSLKDQLFICAFDNRPEKTSISPYNQNNFPKIRIFIWYVYFYLAKVSFSFSLFLQILGIKINFGFSLIHVGYKILV